MSVGFTMRRRRSKRRRVTRHGESRLSAPPETVHGSPLSSRRSRGRQRSSQRTYYVQAYQWVIEIPQCNARYTPCVINGLFYSVSSQGEMSTKHTIVLHLDHVIPLITSAEKKYTYVGSTLILLHICFPVNDMLLLETFQIFFEMLRHSHTS